MSEDLGRRLFSFGVITDTHLNQGEDDCNSPFEVNTLANRRMRHVVRDLNARDGIVRVNGLRLQVMFFSLRRCAIPSVISTVRPR